MVFAIALVGAGLLLGMVYAWRSQLSRGARSDRALNARVDSLAWWVTALLAIALAILGEGRPGTTAVAAMIWIGRGIPVVMPGPDRALARQLAPGYAAGEALFSIVIVAAFLWIADLPEEGLQDCLILGATLCVCFLTRRAMV